MNTIDWHSYEGYILENEHLRVVIVPTLGAKIVSLVDKATNHEWLAPPTNPVRARAYGDTFTDHDLAGWDEMFPTIVACPSPREPSAMLPDHGEVWALPWDVNFVNERYLDTQVTGRAMPYELMRVAQLSDEGSLVLAYKLRNTGHASLFGLWAAHPLFNANQHTRIELPAQVTHVVNVVEHPVWGTPERVLDYPFTSGIAERLDRVGSAARKDYRKYYVPPEQTVASVALVQEDIGRSLRISWRGAVPRYLGVWVDEGTYSRGTTVALEPASGYYDSLKLAIKNQRSTVVLPGEVKTWWLQVQCGNA